MPPYQMGERTFGRAFCMLSKTVTSNVMAGVLVAIINITVAISVAALMFSGTKPEYFATGVSILLLGTVVCGLGGTLGSGFHGVIIAPRSGLAPVFTGIIASIIAAIPDSGSVLPTIIMTIMVTTLAIGIILFLLGFFRLGGLVRYIPYPVMGGFFAGIGAIFVRGGVSVASGKPLSIENLDMFLDPAVVALVVPALIFAVTLYVLQRRTSHWAVFPSILLIAFSGFYLVSGVMGFESADAAAAGWLPEITSMSVTLPIFDFSQLALVDWVVIAAQAGSIVTVAVLCSIFLLLDTSGIEIIANCELKPDRELKLAGITNVVNGLVGGYPGVHVASDTAFTFKLGGNRRLMGLVYAGTVAFAMAAGTGFIGTIPTFILGGLLVYVGIDFLIDWAWRTRNDLPLLDYLMILLILGVITFIGILEGVAFGFFVAIVLFVINYSRLSVIKNEISGAEHASHVDRNPEKRRILNEYGGQIHIMKLQGFIFFGTADGLFEAARTRVETAQDGMPVRYLVLDFLHVSELDTSAVQAFSKLAKFSDAEGIYIAMTAIDEKMRERLDRIKFFTSAEAEPARVRFHHLDDGVAWLENTILAEHEMEMEENQGHHVTLRLTAMLGDEDAAREISPYFETVRISAGEYLFNQGDPGDSLYVLDSGTAAVVIIFGDGNERIIRIFEEGTLLGEMALYTQAPRSASVRIEEAGTLYRLPINKFSEMQENHPAAAGLFHSFVVRLLAERLDRANRELRNYS